MRKKQPSNKQPEQAKRMGRPKLEELGISRTNEKIIRRISDMAQVPVDRVCSDVVEIGIAAVWSKYKNLIEMEEERKERRGRLKNLLNNEPEPSETVGQRIAAEQPELAPVEQDPPPASQGLTNGDSYAIGVDPAFAGEDRSVDVAIEPGFGPTAYQGSIRVGSESTE